MNLIIVVTLLLTLCVTVDYATNDTITSNNTTLDVPENVTLVNGSYCLDEGSGEAISDGKLYEDKTVVKKSKKKKDKVPTITIRSKPSCGCNYGYHWHTKSYVNYCPNCGHYGCLVNKHKWAARYEQELSCSICDSDFCGCCGKEKYSWSYVYLTKC